MAGVVGDTALRFDLTAQTISDVRSRDGVLRDVVIGVSSDSVYSVRNGSGRTGSSRPPVTVPHSLRPLLPRTSPRGSASLTPDEKRIAYLASDGNVWLSPIHRPYAPRRYGNSRLDSSILPALSRRNPCTWPKQSYYRGRCDDRDQSLSLGTQRDIFRRIQGDCSSRVGRERIISGRNKLTTAALQYLCRASFRSSQLI